MTASVEQQEKYYQLEVSPILASMLQHAEVQRDEINSLKQKNPSLWETVREKLRITWTYDSNAIEGSTLSYGDTLFFLREGLTVEGKPFKDFVDAKNHAEAIDFLYDVVSHNRGVSESFIKELNALLLKGVDYIPAINEQGQKINKPATPGQYKKQANRVLQTDGSVHHFVEPIHVSSEMAKLCDWIESQKGDLHPIAVGAVAHYNLVRIHPFDDGNGRGARILMNLILMKAGYPPAIVKNEKRRKYLEVLQEANTGNLEPFVEFIVSSLAITQEMILEDMAYNP
ncbi:Fic family protein [Candidatus Terasakiella magnetica]|nr:Fic family protein [Candidatus Terasakiella magnetica]